MLRKSHSVQDNAAKTIIEAFKRTSSTAFDVETYLLSIKNLFNKMIGEVTLRLATGPPWDDITLPRMRHSLGFSRRKCEMRTPLQLLLKDLDGHT